MLLIWTLANPHFVNILVTVLAHIVRMLAVDKSLAVPPTVPVSAPFLVFSTMMSLLGFRLPSSSCHLPRHILMDCASKVDKSMAVLSTVCDSCPPLFCQQLLHTAVLIAFLLLSTTTSRSLGPHNNSGQFQSCPTMTSQCGFQLPPRFVNLPVAQQPNGPHVNAGLVHSCPSSTWCCVSQAPHMFFNPSPHFVNLHVTV
jgi:hypothetical protein